MLRDGPNSAESPDAGCHANDRLGDMLLGYMRVSKADGSQVLDLQRDALLAAGVEAGAPLPGPGLRQAR